MVRNHLEEERQREEEEREAQLRQEECQRIIDKVERDLINEQRDLIIQRALALKPPSTVTSDEPESDDHSTILSGFITLTSRWTAALARGLGFRRSA